MTRTTLSARRSCPGVTATLAGVAAFLLLMTACGGAAPNAAPVSATTTANGSASAGRGFISTLIPLTEAPSTAASSMVATRAPLGTASRAASGTTAVIPPGTPGIVSSTVSATAAGSLTWTDPDNTISLRYPVSWRATPAATPADDDLRLDGPTNQTMFVDILTADSSGPAPTVDEALQLIQTAQARSTQYSYTYGMVQDVMIGGQRAKYLDYQYTPKANQTATAAKGAIWAVQSGDRTFVLRASNIGAGRTDIDAIIGSVTFPPPPPGSPTVAATARPGSMAPPARTGAATNATGTPAASAAMSPAPPRMGTAGVTGTPPPQSAASPVRGTAASGPMPPASPAMVMSMAQAGPGTFADPNMRVAFQFPQGWKLVNPGGASSSFFELDGPDGALLFVGINDSPGNLDDALRNYRESQQKSQIFTFMEKDVMDVQISGESGKLVTYTYASQAQPSDPPRNGVAWIVVRSGKQFNFDAQNIGNHRPDIDAIIATIRFTK